jgi:sodium/hydrogen antiporter
MTFNHWLLLAGALVLVMGLAHPWVKRAPFTPAMLYLAVGLALGPWGVGFARVDPAVAADWLHHGAEVAVIISLFTVGLKLRLLPTDPFLRPAICLAFISMTITVGLVSAVAVASMGWSWGAAILLGGIIAPTDPVLASDVQLRNARDRDRVRLTLSAEAGLNDGTAFPFVILGLTLIHKEDLGVLAWRWWTLDVAWAVVGGLGIGAFLGRGLGLILLRLNTRPERVLDYGEYLVLGVVGVSYALAVEARAYGFLSVFAAGVALRTVELERSPKEPVELAASLPSGSFSHLENNLASDPRTAPGYLTELLLGTNEQLDHLLEVTLVLVVGLALASAGIAWEMLWLAPVLFLVIRPVAVLPLILLRRFTRFQLGSLAWFGIRGIGSIYYLFYAIGEGVPRPLQEKLTSLTMTLVAISIVVHGLSVAPWLVLQRRDNRGGIRNRTTGRR